MLEPDRIAFYRDNGYLLVEAVFGPAELAELRRVTADLVAAAREVSASNAVYDLAPEHGPARPAVRRIKDPQNRHPVYAAAARSKRLLDIVADLLGPGVRFDHGKLNIKPVGGSAAIEWHQDWAFYPHTNDDLLAVGILLEDCTAEKGPLLVVPGSHKGPVYDHHHEGRFVGAFDPAVLGPARETAVALTGAAGSCTFHHVRTVHGSADNESDSPRPLLLFSYAAVDAWPLVDPVELAEFDGRILRGRPTLIPRQEAVPVRLPLPKDPAADSIFDNQAAVSGQSFGAKSFWHGPAPLREEAT
ncbi:MAG: phytanoyl-CoA dioxygenase family protein [Rhodospirillales bacterium]|nr:phytanoyl-CoA dioxygenase family protein [Rhodospirillales bacterium]